MILDKDLYINVNRSDYSWNISSNPLSEDVYNNEFIHRKIIDNDLARHTSIAITNKCNLNCSYCYKSVNIDKLKCEIPTDIIFNYINILTSRFKAEVKTIQLIGGEPLLHSNIIEIIDFLLSKNIGVRISTNGVSKIIQSGEFIHILENPLVELRVSLDSIYENVHDSTRGHGSYKKVIDNIKYIQKFQCALSVKSVITRQNINNIKDTLIYLRNNGVENFTYNSLYNIGNSLNDFFEENYVSDTEILKKLLEIFEEDITFATMFKPNMIKHVLENLFIKNIKPFSKVYFYVDYYGNIYPQDQLNNRDYLLGNIYDLSLDSFDLLVNKFKSIKQDIEICKKTCLKCNFYPFCPRGNYGELYNLDKTLKEEFTNCNDLRNLIYSLMIQGNKSRNLLLNIYN